MRRRYDTLIGTGGIGSGLFFRIDGMATLGREESRSGVLLDQRDYCKLHIVSHYVASLMGAGFSVIPVGCVGMDDPGDRLLAEMAEAGLDLRFVRRSPERSTTYAICLVYPDGSGCNLTTTDSASSRVDARLVEETAPEFTRHHGRGVCAALPEVPLAARRALLEMGTRHAFLRVASFSSGELRELRRAGRLVSEPDGEGWLGFIDLLAVNLDEAAAFCGMQIDAADPVRIVEAMVSLLATRARAIMATVTAGSRGSWLFDGADLHYLDALPVRVVGTAGAGDAHLAGIICGLSAGMTPSDAHELARLVAAMSVTSPHTIHDGVDTITLRSFASQAAPYLSSPVSRFLTGRVHGTGDKPGD